MGPISISFIFSCFVVPLGFFYLSNKGESDLIESTVILGVMSSIGLHFIGAIVGGIYGVCSC